MAQALISGLIKASYEIEVVGRSLDKLELLQQKHPQIKIVQLTNNLDISDKNIIFCVKPFNLEEVSSMLKGTANSFYSVLAGTTIQNIKKCINSKAYIRTMPNVSAKFSLSMTTLTGDKSLKSNAENIFNCIGETLWVDSENELDIATAVAGSGPAFLAHIADGIISGGIESGLKKEDAIKLTNGLFNGFLPLLKEDEPKDIITKVMSPNGTTEAGYNYLVQNNIKKEITNTIKAAYNRALELSKN